MDDGDVVGAAVGQLVCGSFLQVNEISAWRMKASSFSILLKTPSGEWSPQTSLLHVDAQGYPRNVLLRGGNVPRKGAELLFLFTNRIFLLLPRARASALLSVAFSSRKPHAECSSPFAMTKCQRMRDTTPQMPGPALRNQADGNRKPALCWARGRKRSYIKNENAQLVTKRERRNLSGSSLPFNMHQKNPKNHAVCTELVVSSTCSRGHCPSCPRTSVLLAGAAGERRSLGSSLRRSSLAREWEPP